MVTEIGRGAYPECIGRLVTYRKALEVTGTSVKTWENTQFAVLHSSLLLMSLYSRYQYVAVVITSSRMRLQWPVPPHSFGASSSSSCSTCSLTFFSVRYHCLPCRHLCLRSKVLSVHLCSPCVHFHYLLSVTFLPPI